MKAWLSFVAYVILAVCIVYGTVKIEQEFHDAHKERCAIVRVQIDLATLEIAQLRRIAPEDVAQAERTLADSRRKVNEGC